MSDNFIRIGLHTLLSENKLIILCLGKFTLSDFKKKIEPEPGFEPQTSRGRFEHELA